VHRAWALHFALVRRSLERAYYQGWDLHPHQLPTRYAATMHFYRAGYTAAADRLVAYLGRAESGVADEPATAIALSRYLLRGIDAGAVVEADLSGWNLTVAGLQLLVTRRGQVQQP
jgi:hypothetical protein